VPDKIEKNGMHSMPYNTTIVAVLNVHFAG